MTITNAVALSIEINIRDGCQIKLNGDVVAESELSLLQLKGMHELLRADLDEFRTALADVKQWNLNHVLKHLLRLQRRGRLFLLELTKGNDVALGNMVDMCRRACPSWHKGFDCDAQLPGLISVRTTLGSGIPVEMLPLFELKTPEKFRGDLTRIAASFLGFSAILMRNIGANPPDTDRLLASPRLPIKSFLYNGLPGIDVTYRSLKQNPLLDLDGLWPDANVPKDDDFAAALARHLWEPDRSFSGGDRRPPDQICFFACHCDTTAKHPAKYTLTLHTGEQWRPKRGVRKVDLETLTDELAELRRCPGAARRGRPLVFLNACGTAVVDPAGASSFPELFLKHDLGFLGFIGTETTVPDAFAAAFTQVFFEYLLAEMEIGRVMHASRWKLLNEQTNPLGIVYSLYAAPEIRVRRLGARPDVPALGRQCDAEETRGSRQT
jgi:hypothetical protein